MKKFVDLKVGDKLLVAYHDGDVNVRDMGRSICFEELVIKNLASWGLHLDIDVERFPDEVTKPRNIFVESDSYFNCGVDCVLLPNDEDNKEMVQELLYVGVMMRNRVINSKVRGFFNSIELEGYTNGSGYVKF